MGKPTLSGAVTSAPAEGTATARHTRPGRQLLGFYGRVVGVLVRLTDVLLVVTMALLVAVTLAGVIWRYLINSALPWTGEVGGYLFVALTFLGAVSGLARRSLPRIEILEQRLPGVAGAVTSAIARGCSILFLAALVKLGIDATVQNLPTSMVTLPVSQGYVYAVLPFSAVVMLMIVVQQFLEAQPKWYEWLGLGSTLVFLCGLLALFSVIDVGLYVYLAAVLLISLLLGTPVALSIGLAGLMALSAGGIPTTIVPQRLFAGSSDIVLLAIPLFMLTGVLMSTGDMANRIASFATAVLGRIRGGLGIADVATSVVFADISGSAVADSAAIGSVMIPQLTRRGYPVEFASALQASAGSLGLMFPPSSTMIVYSVVAGVSVSQVFLHSFVPGLMVAITFALFTHIMARRRGYPREKAAGVREVLRAGKRSFFALLTPLIILVSILGGVTTPSEAGVIAAVYALAVGLVVHRDIRVRTLYSIGLEASINAARVTFIISAAILLSFALASFQGPQEISALLLDVSHNPIIVLILLNLLLVVLHTVLEGISTVLIVVPVILPLLASAHIDPVVFGVILAQNSALGLLFPPLGFNLYVISSISNLAVAKVARAVIPFCIVLAADIMVLILFPQIATFLPSIINGR